MAKQRRVATARPSRAVRSKPRKPARAATGSPRARPSTTTAAVAVPPSRSQPPELPPAASKRPAYSEAIAAYETGVRALQRHDFQGAAEHFRAVLHRHPGERELVERATLYLRVCERETANRPIGPRTPGERIYAATLALNAGDAEGALGHLRQALRDDPDNDHANYIMAVALSDRSRIQEAVRHLRQAIALNPDNRSLARQDPDLATLRETAAGRELLDSPVEPVGRRPRRR